MNLLVIVLGLGCYVMFDQRRLRSLSLVRSFKVARSYTWDAKKTGRKLSGKIRIDGLLRAS